MNNPVLWLELRIRIRARKLWIVTSIYLLCLFAISCIAVTTAATEGINGNPGDTGLTIFGFGIFSLLGLLVILGPLASAGVISQEREQRTLPALMNTPMSPVTIVVGKLLAAWIFILWLAVLSLPFLGLGVIWGALNPSIMLEGLGLAVAAGFVSSAIAVGLSGYFQRSLTSYLATGAVMFFWVVVWPIFGALALNLVHIGSGNPAETHPEIYYTFFYHNPVMPLVSLIASQTKSDMPVALIPFALGVWAILSALFFILACRGLRRRPSVKG